MDINSQIQQIQFNSQDHPLTNFSISIYFYGCDISPKCVGCHNQQLQSWNQDMEFNVDFIIQQVLEKLRQLNNIFKNDIKGLQILGGEPLQPKNIKQTQQIIKKQKEVYPDTNIIVYTWRRPIDIYKMYQSMFKEDITSIINNLDYLKSGKYLEKYKNPNYMKTKQDILQTLNQRLYSKDELKNILDILNNQHSRRDTK